MIKRIYKKYMEGAKENNFPIYEYGLLGEKVKRTPKLSDEDRKRAAMNMMCKGSLYKPKGCKLDSTISNYKDGCGKCGSGMNEKCSYR